MPARRDQDSGSGESMGSGELTLLSSFTLTSEIPRLGTVSISLFPPRFSPPVLPLPFPPTRDDPFLILSISSALLMTSLIAMILRYVSSTFDFARFVDSSVRGNGSIPDSLARDRRSLWTSLTLCNGEYLVQDSWARKASNRFRARTQFEDLRFSKPRWCVSIPPTVFSRA